MINFNDLRRGTILRICTTLGNEILVEFQELKEDNAICTKVVQITGYTAGTSLEIRFIAGSSLTLSECISHIPDFKTSATPQVNPGYFGLLSAQELGFFLVQVEKVSCQEPLA